MLPFLDKKKMVASIAQRRGKSVEVADEVKPGGSQGNALESAAHDIMMSIEGKSPMDLAKALKAAFMILESEPHEEAGEAE